MSKVYPVIIVGAGASGLACAKELHAKGIEFLLLEAKSRIGGRVMSVDDPDISLPIDLGAEFIHGAAPLTLELMQSFGLGFYDLDLTHHYLRGKKLSCLPHYWDDLEKLMARLARKKGPDLEIAKEIEALKLRDPAIKAAFISYVEGFHAADTQLMSRRALGAAEDNEERSLNGVHLFRPLQVYHVFLQKILESIEPQNCLRLENILKSIVWKKGLVRLTCEQARTKKKILYQCRRLVLTVPLGVLKSNQICFDPYPQGLQKIIEHLQMGHVQKLILKFKNRFWEDLTETPLGFFHSSPRRYFPTWWTFQPIRAPYLTAWQGGPKALEMGEWSEEKRVSEAIKVLASLTRKSVKALNREFDGCLTHNWSKDPFSLGAYSYISAGGVEIVKNLCRPIENTIYIAGEATISGAPRGTVEGAIHSGQKTAQLITKI